MAEPKERTHTSHLYGAINMEINPLVPQKVTSGLKQGKKHVPSDLPVILREG